MKNSDILPLKPKNNEGIMAVGCCSSSAQASSLKRASS